jgi:periplasmic protein TonB
MTSRHQDTAGIASNSIALVLGAVLFVVLFGNTRPDSWHDSALLPASTNQPSIEVSLQQATPATPPPPVPRKVRTLHAMPRQLPMAEAPAEPQTVPVEQAPAPEEGALIAASSPTASPQPTSDFRPDLEAQYAAGLRADIDRRTRPPDSAQYRLHRPSGEVRVGFTVVRSGEPKLVRVLRSSGSSILDDAAVAIVSSGHYPPMPATLFAGEAEHVFAVTIEFRPAK